MNINNYKYKIIFPDNVVQVDKDGEIIIDNEGTVLSICGLLNDLLRLDIGIKTEQYKNKTISQKAFIDWRKENALKIFLVADYVTLAIKVACANPSYWTDKNISIENNIVLVNSNV